MTFKMKVILVSITAMFFLQGCMETFIMTKDNILHPNPNLLSPDGQPVFADQLSWLYIIGAMKYDIEMDEFEKLLIENKNNFCGVEMKLLPCDLTKEPLLTKIKFHGKLYEGLYYALEGWKDGKKENYIRLAFQKEKLQFALIYYQGSMSVPPIVYFLPGDEESYKDIEKRIKASFKKMESDINKDRKKRGEIFFAEGLYNDHQLSLIRYLDMEKKIADYLHCPHTKEEIVAYCNGLLEGVNEKNYCFKEYEYGTNDPSFVGYENSGEIFHCLKGTDFKADKTLLFYVRGRSESFLTLWHPMLTTRLSDKLYPDDLVFEAYFRQSRLIGVAMRKILCPFPTDTSYFGSLYWTKAATPEGEKVGMWKCDSCYEEKEATYGIKDELIVFWKVE